MKLNNATLPLVLAAAGLDTAHVPSGMDDIDEIAAYLRVDKTALLKARATIERLPFLDLKGIVPMQEAIDLLPPGMVRRYGCLPLFVRNADVIVATGHVDWPQLDEVRHLLPAYHLRFALVDKLLLGELIEASHPEGEAGLVAMFLREGAESELPDLDVDDVAPIVEMLRAIGRRGALQGASDIHLEPFDQVGRVRFRIDGMLTQAFTYPVELHEALIARLKILADLHIVERQRPQDGRFSFEAAGQAIDARVSVLRVLHGEKAVVRLLRPEQAAAMTLDRLGLTPPVEARFRHALHQPHGLVLVTGPTGSGKTTTLYAAIRHLQDESRNITTLEDPIEYRMFGVNQVPVSAQHDRAFPEALRAVLRQDPDVIMVGEIRDRETADIALSGALTGHLLLATLHANDTVEAINRLLDLEVRAANLVPALVAVVAQRLVRKLCECRGTAPVPAAWAPHLGLEAGGTVAVAQGCEACSFTGYRGRMLLFELLMLDSRLRTALLAGATPEHLHAIAAEGGMRTLLHEGLRAVREGQTSLEEVLRVVRHDELQELAMAPVAP